MRRVRFTPWWDLLRGRITARYDVAAQVGAADLPDAAKSLVLRVLRRTRLWKSEKADVALELLAHFADGLEAGVSIDRLIEKFGDERQAAKLIRRAKLRNRPIGWRAVGIFVRAIEIAVVVQLVLAAYFYSGRPSIATNYIDELNKPVLATPMEDRAWPVYRKAILATLDFHPPPEPTEDPNDELAPGGKDWGWLTAWLRGHAEGLKLIRAGAAKPTLGFIFGAHGSSDEAVLFPHLILPTDDSQALHWTPPYIDALTSMAYRLKRDAELAIQDGDSARLADDIAAILGIGDQLQNQPFLLDGSMATFVRWWALEELNTALADHRTLLANSGLVRLAHLPARIDVGFDNSNLLGQRLRFYDTLQGSFTDDGNGDGRLVASAVVGIFGPLEIWTPKERYAFGPTIMLLSASRREMIGQFDHWIELAQADLRRPLRDQPPSMADELVGSMRSSVLEELRFQFVAEYLPSDINDYRIRAENLLAARDGLEIGLALEAYHRQHGQYPGSLSQLTPQFIPAIPIDRFTGEPLKYLLVNGKPTVVSHMRQMKRIEPDRRDPTAVLDNWTIYPLPKDRK